MEQAVIIAARMAGRDKEQKAAQRENK